MLYDNIGALPDVANIWKAVRVQEGANAGRPDADRALSARAKELASRSLNEQIAAANRRAGEKE
jgi:hypothetical protein